MWFSVVTCRGKKRRKRRRPDPFKLAIVGQSCQPCHFPPLSPSRPFLFCFIPFLASHDNMAYIRALLPFQNVFLGF